MMKNFFIPICFLLVVLIQEQGYSQQLAQYSLYMFNNYLLNPAVAGSTPCTEVRLGYRTQWVGFDAHPKTMYASFYKTLQLKKNVVKRGRHAVGAYAEQDETGPSQRTALYLSYSYHLPLTRNYWMGMGIFGGIMQYSFNSGYLYTVIPGDATLASSGNKLVVPDLSPGIWIYSSKQYVGFSIKSIVGNKLTNNGKLTRDYYFTTGYKLAWNGTWALIPSTFIKYTPSSPVGFDINCLADYNNIFAIGVGYRRTDALVAMLKINIRNFFVAYTYDINLSKLKVGNSNSHEIMLGFKICGVDYNSKNSGHGNNSNRNLCPAYN
jgi:type IX secretion system PorP/SprF family membrane protein